MQGYGRVFLGLQAKVYSRSDSSAKHGVPLHVIEYIVSKNSITKENATKQTQVMRVGHVRDFGGGESWPPHQLVMAAEESRSWLQA